MRVAPALMWVAVASLAAGCEPAAKPTAKAPGEAQTPASKPAAATTDSLAAIAQRREACDGDPELNMAGRQECHFQAVQDAKALVSRSKGNALLDPLLADLFEPLLYAYYGEDALSARIVVANAYGDFAQERAAVLTGMAGPSNAQPVGAAFARLGEEGAAFAQRWTAIRNADCTAYPVPNCAARLDAIMAELLDGLDPKNEE